MVFYEFGSVTIWYQGDVSIAIKNSNGDTVTTFSLSSTNKKKDEVALPQNTTDISLVFQWSGTGLVYDYAFSKKEL